MKNSRMPEVSCSSDSFAYLLCLQKVDIKFRWEENMETGGAAAAASRALSGGQGQY
jgi:hypothetical protein